MIPYSLFLGSGPVGQLEIFSALFKTELDKGTTFGEAVGTSYEKMFRIAQSMEKEFCINPFPGTGFCPDDGKSHVRENLEKFHPLDLYKQYAAMVSSHLSLPILAVDGNEKYTRYLSHVVWQNHLEDIITSLAMVIPTGSPYLPYHGVSRSLPEVSGLIESRGYPTLLSGAHFLTIAPNYHTEDHGLTKLVSHIPDNITSLMGDDTQLIFLEEGDLVYDQGRNYVHALDNPDGKESNGLLDFEKHAARFFSLNDSQKRDFKVDIYPKKFLAEYDRDITDYGQVLVKVTVNK
jgi:hypothetical protein